MIKITGAYIKIFLEWENWVGYSWIGLLFVNHHWSNLKGTWSSLHLIFHFGICLKFAIIKCFETICMDLDLADPFLCLFFTWLGKGCGTGAPSAFLLPWSLQAWRWEWPSRKMVKGLCFDDTNELRTLHIETKLHFFKLLLIELSIVTVKGIPLDRSLYNKSDFLKNKRTNKNLKKLKGMNRLIQKCNINSSFTQYFFLVYLLRFWDL